MIEKATCMKTENTVVKNNIAAEDFITLFKELYCTGKSK
jgi:hypothetical protein